MKVLLVTSQVTYIPGNYLGLFEAFKANCGAEIAGFVRISNFSLKLVAQAAGLAFLGAPAVSAQLFSNFIGLSAIPGFRRRERIFSEAGIPVLTTATMNSPEMVSWVEQNGIDLILNVRTRCIYKKPILEAPRLGCINIHHGLLPEYRGTMCDLYALHEGRSAGFTIHVMNEKIDAGRILARREVSAPGEKNYLGYLERSSRLEGETLAALVNQIAETGVVPEGIPNSAERACYSRNPTREQIQEMKKAGLVL